MKKLTIILLAIILFTGTQSCEFEEYQIDPNRTVQATPGLVLTSMVTSAFNLWHVQAMLTSRMLVYTDGLDLNQYYGWSRSDYEEYNNLRQVYKLIEESERAGQPNYVALAKFFRAYHFYNLTMAYGEVPYTNALGGFEGMYKPEYDSQELIFEGILNDLEEANNDLSQTEPPLLGDVMFAGDISLWKKAINSFRLRVLMTLSAKNGGSTIDVSGQFSSIISDPGKYPLMTGNMDNLALQYYDQGGNRYPYFENQNFTSAYLLEQTFVELMKNRADPRLIKIASITSVADSDGLLETDFNAYGGLDGSASFDDLNTEKASGVGSLVDSRYHMDPIAEKGVVLGYAELQFIMAEAAELGWIGGSAATFYTTGIEANMEFYGIPVPDILTYLTHPLVVYNAATGIEQINTQKYLTYFFSTGWESYYNQRRTGVPVFSADGATFNNGKVPLRWMYPESESKLNRENIEASLQRQFGGTDDINGVMWLLK